MAKATRQLILDASHLPNLLVEVMEADGGLVGLDTETSGLNYRNDRICGISLAWRRQGHLCSVYLPVGHVPNLFEKNLAIEPVVPLLRCLLSDHIRLALHTAPFDLLFLRQLLPDFWPATERYYDVSVLARLSGKEARPTKGEMKRSVSSGEAVIRPSLQLADLYECHIGLAANVYLPLTIEVWKQQKRRRSSMAQMMPSAVSDYACTDAIATLELAEFFEKQLAADSSLRDLWEVERRFVLLLARIEDRGLLLDQKQARAMRAEFDKNRLQLARELADEGLLDPGSPTLVSNYLYNHLGLAIGDRVASGRRGSTSRDALEDFAGRPEVRKIIAWRQYTKAITSWIDCFFEEMDDEGFLHPTFEAAGTVSARISCRRPNLQAIPMTNRDSLVYRSLAGIFRAPEGAELYSLDYKQADLRLATCYARENSMAEAFASGDPYTEMAKKIWEGEVSKDRRSLAKRFSLATINAIGAETAAKRFSISQRLAEDTLAGHRQAFPGFPKANRFCENYYHIHGFIPLWTGRKIHLEMGERTHKAFSRLVQGGVAEMIKRAMLEADKQLEGARSRILLQIHDSLVLEVYDDEREGVLSVVKKSMESAFPEQYLTRTKPPVAMPVDVGVWS